MGTRVEHPRIPVERSPSGLPLRHLISAGIGSRDLYLGEQWLAPGDTVRLHTHEVEEILVFLAGTGEVTLGEQVVPVGAGVSVHIPPGEVHGFNNTGEDELRLLVIFPGNEFARTDFVE
jgi:mannose-6-phosphate isomerase-like protein (cupin superfamily)